jgi:hypothetical protein
VRRTINVAAVVNLVVALVTYAILGWTAFGGGAAARNTARFSSVLFALALATHFHPRFGKQYRTLFMCFVAAHGVHYGTVVVYHLLLGRLVNLPFLVIGSVGFLLLLGAAITLTRMPRVHLVLSYVIWAGFAVALASNIRKHPLPDALLATVMTFAMVVHGVYAFRRRPISTSVTTA